MRLFFILLTAMGLFVGCGGSGDSTSTVTIKSINNTDQVQRLTYSNQTYMKHINSIGLNGEALDIAISHDTNYAYIASGDYGLQILDISDKEHPKLIATHYAYGYVNHVEIIENIVYTSYVAQTWDDYERLNAYDVTYPYDARYIGYKEGYKSHTHTKIKNGNYLYYLKDNRLFAINSDYNDYQSYELFSPYALSLCEDYLFVANGRDGVSIFKVENSVTSKLTKP